MADHAAPATCEKVGNQTQAALDEQLVGMVSLILGRLVPAAAASDAALAAALSHLQLASPELYAVVAASRGQNASLPAVASAAVLTSLYEEPAPAPAKAALAGRSLSSTGLTAAVLVARCQARLAELDEAELVAGARPEAVEALDLIAPSGALTYNYTVWDGGPAAYTSCSLNRWEQ